MAEDHDKQKRDSEHIKNVCVPQPICRCSPAEAASFELDHDRRDTLQYWTFWFVAIFGSADIFLSIFQVVLATIQVLQASGKLA